MAPPAVPVAEPPHSGVVVATVPLPEEEHVQRLQTMAQLLGEPSAPPHRRGSAWQRPRRQLEQRVRATVLDFGDWAADRGLNRQQAAARLGLAARTLRCWEEQRGDAGQGVRWRGRPVVRSPRDQRQQVLALLESVGPGLGLASLQGHCTDLPRAELRDLLRRYRRVWRRRHHQALHVLHWLRPGSVWAIDFAEPPLPLEAGFTELLAVRDLASGQQLLWLPVPAATAQVTGDALLWLFAIYGAPLVLKMDNGSPFAAAATQALLAQWQIVALFSPPGLPAYNGAIEAGIGSLKARTHAQAARHGHPELWTCADLEAARQAANTLARPHGAQQPTPAEAWAQRQPVTAAERTTFGATVVQLDHEGQQAAAARASVPCPPPEAQEGAPNPAPEACARPGQFAPETQDRTGAATQEKSSGGGRAAAGLAAIRREAISRALVAHGYLMFRRRRIPLPIKRKKAAKIM